MWLRIPANLGSSVQGEIVDEMAFANASNELGYPEWGGDERGWVGQHAEAYWEDIGGAEWIVQLKSGKSAFDGVSALMNGPTRTDCATMIHAVEASAIAEVVGRDVFDSYFGAEGQNNQDLILGGPGTPSRLQKMFQSVTVSGEEDLQVGDEVYIANVDRYERKHPMGFWKGLNAVYDGEGRFSGFGVSRSTLAEIITMLAVEYNRSPEETSSVGDSAYDASLKGDQVDESEVPGLRLEGVQRIDPAKLDEMYA